jgi:hypothetical protein
VLVDLPLEELRRYRPEVAEPADFDAVLGAGSAPPPATTSPSEAAPSTPGSTPSRWRT